MSLSNEIITEMLAGTKPSKEAIDEARARRDLVKTAAMTYEGALSFIKSGSLAHHTISSRVSDADGSLMLDRRIYRDYGPDSDKRLGPEDLIAGVAEDIRDTIKQVYPDVYISTNHKRAIFFRFRQPLPDGQDPTVDLVIGLNRKDQPGIWIPNLSNNSWDASDPGKHTELVKDRRQRTGHTSSKVVRALKLFSKQWEDELLTSFHWTALMLESYPARKNLISGIVDVLNHAASSLELGDTNDPACVSGPINIPNYRDRAIVLGRIRNAAANLDKASQVDGDDEAALDEVAALLGDAFTKSTAAAALEQAIIKVRQKILDKTIQDSVKTTAPITTQSLGNRPVLNTRAFALTSSERATIAPINNEEPDLSQFEGGVSQSAYRILWRHTDKYKLIYTVSLPSLDRKNSQLVTIEVFSKSIRVVAHGLKNLRHVNHDGSLCLWFPNDKPTRQWTHNKGLLPLLDLIALHLYKESRFKEIGTWLGEEVHNV